MSDETIVAVFDTPEQADDAVRDLRHANVPDSAISRHARAASGMAATSGTADAEPPREQGFWSRLFGGDTTYEHEAHYDRDVYDRSMESGSTVISIQVPDERVGEVTEILDRHNPVDIDERATGYGFREGSGLAAPPPGVAETGYRETSYDAPVAFNAGPDVVGRSVPGQPIYDTTGSDLSGTERAQTEHRGPFGRDATAEQRGDDADTMRLAEERLAVGKRLVNRGTTRVRRYVVETPVEQQVTLHDEHVTLDRRPVSDHQRPSDADFSERTIEMSETAEEAVVTKEAFVTEEVRLRREATDRVETVRDTVRREEVEVQEASDKNTTPRR
ncbi:MAG: YsnF/AvaK domain-containing protein [Proteobacteria bacterium]|nr:YsnF/AvaK domain-containing protein [Pseudomonadota bacterium]